MKIFSISLLILVTWCFWSCSGEGQAETSEKTENLGTPVSTMELKSKNFAEYLNLTGVIKANSQVKVVSEESGILTKLIYEKGQYVSEGKALAVLENKILEAGANQAEAAFQQAELDYNSNKVLYEKKAISENQLKSSELNLTQARAAYELAKTRLDKLTISAPITGYVNDRYVDKGAYVMPASPVFELVDNQMMKVNFGVAERFIRFIKKGSAVTLTFDAFPDLEIKSTLTFVAKSIDPDNRTFQVETTFKNPDGKLAPDMIANIQLLKMNHENSIVIPIDALLDSEAGRFVIVATNNLAEKKYVDMLAIEGDNVLVDGLQADQQLVIMGHQSLSDGDTLNIVNE